jgi:ketosteroid isomerase-like protein
LQFTDSMSEDPILASEAELRSAMLAGDVATLDRLIDDALMFTGPDGAVVGKQEDLNAHRSRRLQLTRLEPSDERVTCEGAIAIVSVRMDLAGTWDGAAMGGTFRYTRVWCQRPDGWRVIAGHVSAVLSN